MKLFKTLLVVLFFAQTAQAGLGDFFEKKDLPDRVREEIADLDIKFKVSLFDLSLFDGMGLSSRYRYEVEPSYQNDFHTRVDKWRINASIRPGDIIDTDDLPVYLNIDKGSSVYFVRQFKTKKNAMLARPYHFKHLPVTAEKAIKRLNVGDFVAFPSNLTVVIGSNASTVSGPLDAGVGVYYLAQGDFLIHIFRMKDNKVRLKLIAQRKQGRGVNGSLEAEIDLFGIKILDKQIKRVFETDLVKMGMDKSKGNQFIIDYVFDLNDVDAREAYNEILSSTYKFKDLEIFKEHLKDKGLDKRLISTYEKAEKLHIEDLSKETKRVSRIFKGLNRYEVKSKRLKIGLILASYKRDKIFTQNNVSYEEADGNKIHFYYPNYSFEKKGKYGIGPLRKKETVRQSVFGLVPTDAEGYGDTYTDYGLTLDVRDEVYRAEEQVKVVQAIKDTLPKQLFESIDWGQWREYDYKRSARLFFQVIFKGNAFESLKEMSLEKLQERLKEFYTKRVEENVTPVHSFLTRVWRTITLRKVGNKAKIEKLGVKLHEILSKDLKGKEKISKIMELRDNSVFEEIGFGFLISLLDQSRLDEFLYIKLKLMADEVDSLEYTMGTRNFSNVYKELQHIMNSINNRSYDLRLTTRDEQQIKK